MINVKCALALAGGYVLGRTRKAKAAIGLGLWISGRNYHAKDVVRDQVVRLLHSADGEQLINQIRGPATEAGRRAAVAVYEAQIDRLSDALTKRTERLTATLGDSEKVVRDSEKVVREGAEAAVGGLVGAVTPGKLRDRKGGGQPSSERTDERGPSGNGPVDEDHAETQNATGRDRTEAGRAADQDDSDEGGTEPAAERRVPDRSAGPRRDTSREPLERAAQGSTGGGAR
ncbi:MULTISPECIES: hypothetical protein [unclassified Parafrankia]|uniref:hypothetical protein n=1 Tax=unclassified Parafrankia TaxID=2994368 RepID=UPI000DA4DA70|nr:MULTISPECIES: hypothetical protein [unclassified Parafrankia]TCJ31999.1 hypothetical protein E0504_45375 [Parafrankia sp. BMG5.11]SQD96865.1 conserved hypothetical protein [Parafrankia sp. Ea1.12]